MIEVLSSEEEAIRISTTTENEEIPTSISPLPQISIIQEIWVADVGPTFEKYPRGESGL